MRSTWVSWVAAPLSLIVVVQLMPGVPDLPVGTGPASAQPVDPVPPPAAVDPDPYLRVVEAAGPTTVSTDITKDTIWGPQGSPYVVQGADVDVVTGVSLTLLPGTVVKLREGVGLGVQGQILVLGTPHQQVVITSVRDDSVMGDTNGDGDATAPAQGEWTGVNIAGGVDAPVSVFDYADIRYGGNDVPELCVTWAAVMVGSGSRAIVANSRFTETQTGVRVSGPDEQGFAGVYNSHFGSGMCGVSVRNRARAEVVGNTFEASFTERALQAESLRRLRFWFNTVHGPVMVYNTFDRPPTRDEADVRFNALLGPINDFPWTVQHPLTDWSGNWFGHDANAELPTCMDPDVAAGSHPPIQTQPSSTCPAGQEEVVGYRDTVLPALSGSPQVLPESAREAAAPRFGLVNTYLGSLTYQVEDLAIEDAGKQVAATRTYRSDRLSEGDAGAGWTSAFSESLSQVGDLTTLRFSDGSALGFPFDPATGYTPAPGVSAELVSDSAGTTVTTPGRTGYHFDLNGELVRVTLGDDGHELTVERSGGQVSRVVGESGRHLAYERSGGRLASITDQTGRGVTLAYTGDQLITVQGVDGQTETYTYDAVGRLTRVTTPAGRVRLAAEYGSDGRVAWLEQQGTRRATFAYDDANAARTITLADGTVIRSGTTGRADSSPSGPVAPVSISSTTARVGWSRGSLGCRTCRWRAMVRLRR